MTTELLELLLVLMLFLLLLLVVVVLYHHGRSFLLYRPYSPNHMINLSRSKQKLKK